MKYILSLLGAVLFSAAASGSSLASIYNGEQFTLDGQLLVQDADQPSDFYYLPRYFRIKRESVYDEKSGTLSEKVSLNHRILTISGHRYSNYSIRLILDEPEPLELLRATSSLRRAMGHDVRIKGVAPICGMRIALPGLTVAESTPAADPEARTAQYSISSSEGSKCNSILATTEFTLEYRVPLALEPGEARNITSDVGLTVPPIELILPYKYKDKVSISVDALSAVKQLKAGADLEGSLKAVSAQVQANISNMMNSLQVSGQLKVDCQNPDRTICDRFVTQAAEILGKTLYIYLPMAGSGDTNPLVVGDKDNAVSTNMFKAKLGFDEQSAVRAGNFTVDFSNVVYDAVHAEAQIDASGAPVDSLAPEVRRMLEAQP